jgi:hypothetical protein
MLARACKKLRKFRSLRFAAEELRKKNRTDDKPKLLMTRKRFALLAEPQPAALNSHSHWLAIALPFPAPF